MDCRKTVALALGLLGGLGGCQSQQVGSGLPGAVGQSGNLVAAGLTADVVVNKPGPLPKRTPRAETCVAFGDFKAHEADGPEHTSAERQLYYDQARKAYQQALEIDPRCLGAHRGLAALYVAMDDHAHAVAAYQRAVKVHPREATLWFALGVCHSRKKEWGPALTGLGKAVELEPENRRYADTLAVALAASGRCDESLRVFARFNNEATAHYKLAGTLRRLGKPDLCRQHLELALSKDPNLAPAQALLAELQGRPAQPVQPVALSEPQPGPDEDAPADPGAETPAPETQPTPTQGHAPSSAPVLSIPAQKVAPKATPPGGPAFNLARPVE